MSRFAGSRLIYAAIIGASVALTGAALPGAAWAQNGAGTGSGMNSNNGSMSGANLNVDNGIMANGTPKQQAPGASMTNGPVNGGIAGTLNGDGVTQPGGPAAVPAHSGTAIVKPTGPTGVGDAGQTGN